MIMVWTITYFQAIDERDEARFVIEKTAGAAGPAEYEAGRDGSLVPHEYAVAYF